MRKTKTVKVEKEGRDLGKQFLLTEMPVYKAEKWGMRALLALAKAGLTDMDPTEGISAISQIGLGAIGNLPWEDAEPLLDEMMSCVKRVTPAGPARDLVEGADDIEEMSTMLMLRKEILGLHFDFFSDAEPSISATSEQVAEQTT